MQIIANLAVILEPFLPFSSKKLRSWLSLDEMWGIRSVPAGLEIPKTEALFKRIDKETVEEETEKLNEYEFTE